MQNSNSKDGAEVPQSTEADVTTSSPAIAKPNVGCCTDYIEAIQNLFYVSGDVDECEPELVYKFYVHNTQRKDSNGSYNSTYKNALETLCGITFKIHSLSFKDDLILYEVVLINDDYKRKDDVHNSVITVYEETEEENMYSDNEKVYKNVLNIYSKRDCYKVLDHLYKMRTGVKGIKDQTCITKHKLIIQYLDITMINSIEIKGK